MAVDGTLSGTRTQGCRVEGKRSATGGLAKGAFAHPRVRVRFSVGVTPPILGQTLHIEPNTSIAGSTVPG